MAALRVLLSVTIFVVIWLFIIFGFFWNDSYKSRFVASVLMLIEAVLEMVSAPNIQIAWWIIALWFCGFLIWLIDGIRVRRRVKKRMLEMANAGTRTFRPF